MSSILLVAVIMAVATASAAGLLLRAHRRHTIWSARDDDEGSALRGPDRECPRCQGWGSLMVDGRPVLPEYRNHWTPMGNVRECGRCRGLGTVP